ncbi:hypothetical protein B0H14DRAFT_3550890 [Mycena olivaceomarginata]|nr:hypothetical protein B0H14DRAFT_3550890 [Mycena olivaceomarginata]
MKLCTCLQLLSFYFPAASPIRLVDFDFDYVTLSSLDRHAPDVGTPKVLSLSFLPMPCHADRFIYSSYSTLLCYRSAASRSRARWVEADARVEVWRADKDGDADREGEGGSCWRRALGVDAIYNIPTKELPCCHERGTKVFSSMGAGARSELMRVQIAGFASTVYDPREHGVRPPRALRAPHCASASGAAAFPQAFLPPLPKEEFKKGKVGELGVLDEWRVRILSGLGPLPAIFGVHIVMQRRRRGRGRERAGTLAGWVVRSLVFVLVPATRLHRPPLSPRPLFDCSSVLPIPLMRSSSFPSCSPAPSFSRLPLDEDDVALLFEDVNRGRNAVPPHAVPVKPIVVRWDPARALGVENVVVIEAGEAGVHESDGGEGGPGARGEDVREAVRRHVEEVERVGHVKKERRTGPRLLRGPRRLETQRHNATTCFKTYTRKPAMQQHKMDVFDMIYLEQGVG